MPPLPNPSPAKGGEGLFKDAAARLAHAASMLLGWRPDEYWNATPAELALAITPPGEANEGPPRADIEALMARFPDQVKD